jgi:hypothetical protein
LADGSEQVVLEYIGLGRVFGYIDLQNMVEGDEVVIRQYMRLKPGGAFKRYAQASFSGVQTDPVVYIQPKEVDYGVRVTLQQIAGVFKSFDFNFLYEV